MIQHDLFIDRRKWNRSATPVLVLEMDLETAEFIESCLPPRDSFTKDFSAEVARLQVKVTESEDE